MAARSNLVRLDLNSPEFQDVFFRLEVSELRQVVGSLRRLGELDWSALYRHHGFQWETIGTAQNRSHHWLRAAMALPVSSRITRPVGMM